MNAIYRYEVPVDDQWHEFDLTGDVLSVGCRKTEWVEFWALHDPTKATKTARFIVVGTGHPVDETWVHRGTAVAPGGFLVWHLMQAFIAHKDPQRVRASVEADRAILDRIEEAIDRATLRPGVRDGRDPDEREADERVAEFARTVLDPMASRYAGHPDYREAWAT